MSHVWTSRSDFCSQPLSIPLTFGQLSRFNDQIIIFACVNGTCCNIPVPLPIPVGDENRRDDATWLNSPAANYDYNFLWRNLTGCCFSSCSATWHRSSSTYSLLRYEKRSSISCFSSFAPTHSRPHVAARSSISTRPLHNRVLLWNLKKKIFFFFEIA